MPVAREAGVVAVAVTAVALLSVVTVLTLRAAEQEEDRGRIDRAAQDVARTIETELDRVADLAQDVAVAVALVPELDAGSYGAVLEAMAIPRRFPAVTGVSYVERVPRAQVAERLVLREPGGPPLQLLDDAGEDLVRLLTMSHPLEANRTALGVDLGSRPESRRAHDLAAELQRPVMANFTRIVQLPPDEPGVSVHAPVLADGEVVATIGLVLSVPGLLSGLEPVPVGVAVAVRDPGSGVFPAPIVLAATDALSPLQASAVAELPGQRWEVEVTATSGFAAPTARRASTLVAIGGGVVALLVGLLVASLASRERRASELALRRTVELSQANEQLASLNARLSGTNVQLEAAGRAKDDFLAAVSHELRTPLTVIRGFMESLRRMQPQGLQLEEMLDPIDRNVRRLDTLVADLLTLVSLDAGALVSRPEPVALSGFLDRAPIELAGLPPGRVRVQITGDPYALVDRAHLERIVTNLLVNADRHGGGAIVLQAAHDGDGQVVISVRDHGPGIPDDQVETVFRRFVRADGQRAVTGTGLGLAIVRELVELGRGRVEYEPAAPGARFLVRLPAATGGSALPA